MGLDNRKTRGEFFEWYFVLYVAVVSNTKQYEYQVPSPESILSETKE